MLTPDMLDDAQAAFAAEIKAGVNPAAALAVAISAALQLLEPTALKTALDNERERRKQEAYIIRHAVFSARAKPHEIQELISYLVRWHTSFSVARLARISGYGITAINDEIRTWIAANPGRLVFDDLDCLYRTPRTARRIAAQAERTRLEKEPA